jgi:GTP cyclohydrolase I
MAIYQKIEKYDSEVTGKLAENYSSILQILGEDVTREGLQKKRRYV